MAKVLPQSHNRQARVDELESREHLTDLEERELARLRGVPLQDHAAGGR